MKHHQHKPTSIFYRLVGFGLDWMLIGAIGAGGLFFFLYG